MNKTKNKEVGDLGEDLVCNYLIKDKYKILFRNYREKFDEIDIIARAFNRTLVFVEVKTVRGERGLNIKPEDNLTAVKFKKVTRACRIFAGSHPWLIDKKIGWRIDLIAITLGDSSKLVSINHYKNISV